MIWRIRLTLLYKKLPWEAIPWRFTEKDAIAFSGQGKVPVIIDGERIVTDSWAIAQYLEEIYPESPLAKGEARKAIGYPTSESPHNRQRKLIRHFGRFLSCCIAMLDARMSLCDNSDLQNPSDKCWGAFLLGTQN